MVAATPGPRRPGTSTTSTPPPGAHPSAHPSEEPDALTPRPPAPAGATSTPRTSSSPALWFRQAQPAVADGRVPAHGVVSTIRSLRSLLDHLGRRSTTYGR